MKKLIRLKKSQGITLVALVVTIVVLLILAGITITMLFSENGIIKKAQEAANKTTQDQDNTQKGMDSLEDKMNDSLGAPSKTGYLEEKGVNKPKLGKGMTAIKYDETNKTWVDVQEPEKDASWYSYTQTDKMWANARTEDGSMWVWIPRYAYRIESNYHNGGEGVSGEINIAFLQGSTNIPAKSDVKIVEYNESTTENYTKFPEEGYVVHPAFTSNTKMGGWSSEITGIWVAKFEASRSDATATNSGTSTILKIQPSVVSWINNLNVDNAYTTCLKYNTSLNSHLIKPTEWGATVYLAQSNYGKASEIGMNECSNYITGAGPSAENDVYGTSYTYASASSDATTLEKYMYTGSQGIKASSTGNVYGVYDLAGGAYEYVATYLDNNYVKKPGTEGAATSGNRYQNGASLINGSDRTKLVYKPAITDNYKNNYEENKGKYGDMIWETSNDAGYTGEGAWYRDSSYFPRTTDTFLVYGCNYEGTYYGGAFGYVYYDGYDNDCIGIRPTLIVD